MSPYGASDIGLDAVALEVDVHADRLSREVAQAVVERRRILAGFGARVLEDEPGSDVELDEVAPAATAARPASAFWRDGGCTPAAITTGVGRIAQNHLRRLNFVDGPSPRAAFVP